MRTSTDDGHHHEWVDGTTNTSVNIHADENPAVSHHAHHFDPEADTTMTAPNALGDGNHAHRLREDATLPPCFACGHPADQHTGDDDFLINLPLTRFRCKECDCSDYIRSSATATEGT
jgi:hypothetical protein